MDHFARLHASIVQQCASPPDLAADLLLPEYGCSAASLPSSRAAIRVDVPRVVCGALARVFIKSLVDRDVVRRYGPLASWDPAVRRGATG